MSNNNKSVSVWFFKAGEDKVLLRKVPLSKGLFSSKPLTKMLGYDNFETYSYTDPMGLRINILMNEMGMYEDTIPNLPATQVLGKIKLNWGERPFLRGNYMVYASSPENEDGEDERVDMPTKSFQDFVKEFNEAIDKSNKAREKFWAEAGVKQ